ncbi:MAG: methyltransferase domain-containing protein [Chloroflexota bacterium]
MADQAYKNVYHVPYHWMLSDFFKKKYEYPIELLRQHLREYEIVLDIGCGDGRLTSLLAERIGWIVGLDHQLLPLRFARLLVQRENLCLLRQDLLLSPLPFANDAFDWVTCFDVIEHIPREAVPGLLSEIKRVLKPGGGLALTTPNRDSLRNRIWGHHLTDKHCFELNPREMTQTLYAAELEIIELRGIYLPIPIPKVEHYASVVPFRALFRWLIPLGERFVSLSETMFVLARSQ